jgi:phosphatidylserine/phosphatidylglycerophosphate/cardiolipin synthase-like enzyme
MRFRQSIISLTVFLIAVIFLVFSKSLFHPAATPLQDPVQAMATTDCHALLLPNQEYYPYLKTYFQKAEKSIVGTVYLVKTADYPNNEPAELLRELIAASKRKVEVDLVLERSEYKDLDDSNATAAETLRNSGVHVRFDPADTATHAKTFVVDGRYCFVGSHNLTHAAMSRNIELSVFIDSKEMAQKITDFVRQIPKNQ